MSELQQENPDALTRLVLKESERNPLVLVLENLQWASTRSSSVSWPRVSCSSSTTGPITPGWSNRPGFSELRIDSLPPAGTGEPLRALLGDARTLQPVESFWPSGATATRFASRRSSAPSSRRRC